MGSENLRSIEDLTIRGRWDGGTKFFTNECLECEWYVPLSDGEVCFVGKAWKELTKEKVLNTCAAKKRAEEEQEVMEASKKQLIVYTPVWEDFFDGTIEELVELGFRPRLGPEDCEKTPGFAVEQESLVF